MNLQHTAKNAIRQSRLVPICAAAAWIAAVFTNTSLAISYYEGMTLTDWYGSGVCSAVLVVDFMAGNGASDSFAFGVKFGAASSDTISGTTLLQTVYDNNTNFDYTVTHYSFGDYVSEIAYTDPTTNANYVAPSSSSMYLSYWTSGDFGRSWLYSQVGSNDRIVSNGDVNGWLPLTFTDFTSQPVASRLLDGDANANGTVDGVDLGAVLANFNKTYSGDAWADGDFNADGTVNGADLGAVLANFNQRSNATAGVPEPSTVVLLLVGAAAYCLSARRRRRKILGTVAK